MFKYTVVFAVSVGARNVPQVLNEDLAAIYKIKLQIS